MIEFDSFQMLSSFLTGFFGTLKPVAESLAPLTIPALLLAVLIKRSKIKR